ncbi:MAG TPA: ABC transporter ATP-binding protein [Puia sp.]|nr:ABC transporter ATP-binding protein [Puia sp.]
MSDTIIQVENLSKLYRLGTIGSGTFKRDLNRWLQGLFRKNADSPGQIRETRDNTFVGKEHLWALRNVSFDIKEGEVCGIIGRNGAGKSTLLKVLSKITRPTEGFVRGRGKISSLLEIGTGFHADLSGRENIFISGSMLGMKKAEIRKKFDEIVDFSGIEQFLDTPVKRYSSGMYVRLAFGVAAHLEPDILIVDEVLAVGDAEFQKKCMGKMKDVSHQKGRTILFVSHNLQAVNNLCSRAIWLQKGSINAMGDTQMVVNKYLGAYQTKLWNREWKSPQEAPGNDWIRILSVELIPHLPNPMAPIDIRTPITVKFRFYNYNNQINLSANLVLFSLAGDCIFDVPSISGDFNEGMIEGECTIPGKFLNDGSYYFSLYILKDTSRTIFEYEECLHFDVEDHRENIHWYDKWVGAVRPHFPFALSSYDVSKNGISLLNTSHQL